MEKSKKVVVTITGIRPDFIRMSKVFAELDKHVTHIMIHTGQHYDPSLSEVFFKELGIRAPDFLLHTGKECSNHFDQLSYLTKKIPELFKEHGIHPDLILFLGDSNTAGVSFPLKKEGYRIGHIEAGMRSYDRRMLEEINRTVCDHCSDLLFVYHEDYKQQLSKEGITKNVYVVGNTIVEPLRDFQQKIQCVPKRKDMILLDIHRPENFNDVSRLRRIFEFANICIERYGIPVKMLYFKRLQDAITRYSLDLGRIEIIPLLAFIEYVTTVYHSLFLISDSGTGQEEPALLKTPVIVPRDFTERPQSYQHHCSIRLPLDSTDEWESIHNWIDEIDKNPERMDSSWLGDGTTSQVIIKHLMEYLEKGNTNHQQ